MKDLILGEKKEMKMKTKHKIHILDYKYILIFKSIGTIHLFLKKRMGNSTVNSTLRARIIL